MGGFKELTILMRLFLRERERNREMCIHVIEYKWYTVLASFICQLD